MSTIADLQYGGSSAGVEELAGTLKTKIEAAKAAVKDLTEVNNALDANWAGKAQEKFKESIKSDAEAVGNAIESLFGVLEQELTSIIYEMQNNDLNMFGG